MCQHRGEKRAVFATTVSGLIAKLACIAVGCAGCNLYFVAARVDPCSLEPGFRQGAPKCGAPEAPPHDVFKHVLLIVLENQSYDRVNRNPYFQGLSGRGASFSNFHGLFHPSYSNYLAMVSGRTIETHSDRQIESCLPTIANLLAGVKGDKGDKKTKPWLSFAQGYPEEADGCFIKPSNPAQPLYARKHVPFLTFTQGAPCPNVVPDLAFDRHALPAYGFYSPDLVNDGHNHSLCRADQGLENAVAWLRRFLDPILDDAEVMRDTLIVVTFDESEPGCVRKLLFPERDNHIYTVFLGGMVRAGFVSPKPYNHFNALRTIEENFHLPPLADGDGHALAITDVWQARAAQSPQTSQK
ncbi:MAG TPA: alkaline phosphatase family protein [Thermoanaerobaculia bacterium]|nr:alkaline phosphatase family protein [Thermoanaerobaculia bacterium]